MENAIKDQEMEMASELLNELEGQMFAENMERCTNCGMLDHPDNMSDGICVDCVPIINWRVENRKF
jgi:hypothetical protein